MATSIRTSENIAKLNKASATTLTLAASRANVGAYQYVTASNITLSTGTVGFNGVDAALQNSTLYYVYAVIQSGNLGLCASTSSTGPAGFSQSRMVGSFNTDSSGNIALVEPAFDGNTTNTGLLTVTGGIAGKIDGTTIAAGVIGERISSFIIASSSLALTNNTYVDITNIPLSAGIWDVCANVGFTYSGGSPTGTALVCGISTTSGNSGTGLYQGDNAVSIPTMPTNVVDLCLTIPSWRVTINTTNTYYLKAFALFTVNDVKAYGRISAVRVG